MTPGNITLGLPGNPTPPTWVEPPVGPHWPAEDASSAPLTATTLNDAKITCRRNNNNHIINYYGAMNAAWMSSTSGHLFTVPPIPMADGVIGPFGGGSDDGALPEYSWQVGALQIPVCNALPVPSDHSKNQAEIAASVPTGTIDIGVAFEEGSDQGFFHVGPNDRVKVGKTVHNQTSADGVFGDFLKMGGVAAGLGGGWYERVK